MHGGKKWRQAKKHDPNKIGVMNKGKDLARRGAVRCGAGARCATAAAARVRKRVAEAVDDPQAAGLELQLTGP